MSDPPNQSLSHGPFSTSIPTRPKINITLTKKKKSIDSTSFGLLSDSPPPPTRDDSTPLIIPCPTRPNSGPILSHDEPSQAAASHVDDITDSSIYSRIPVHEFGGALLRGMGWNGAESSEKELKLRPIRLGLGAVPPQETKAKEEKEDKQDNLKGGSVVSVEGRRGMVVLTRGVPGLNRILVRMEGSREEVSVSRGSVKLCSRGEIENHPFVDVGGETGGGKSTARDRHGQAEPNEIGGVDQKRSSTDRDCDKKRKYYDTSRRNRRGDGQESCDRDRSRRDGSDDRDHSYKSDDRQNDRTRILDDDRTNGHSKQSQHSRHSPQPSHTNWLLPNIRVRIVSKKYPKHNLQKGIIQDIIPSTDSGPRAILLMDDNQVLDISERHLQTAPPRSGGNLIVLDGIHRWKKGRLLERYSEEGRGLIQLFEDLEVVDMSLESISEWCGPVDDDLE